MFYKIINLTWKVMNFVLPLCVLWSQTLYISVRLNLDIFHIDWRNQNIIESQHDSAEISSIGLQFHNCLLFWVTDCCCVWKSYSNVIVEAGGRSFSIARHSYFFTWIILLDWKLSQLRNIKILHISSLLSCFTIHPHTHTQMLQM